MKPVFLKFGTFLKTRLFHLSEDHPLWVNLWNIGIWWHALWTFKQALVNWMKLRHELSIISIIYFIYSVQDNQPQVFIEPIWFTVESISKDIILQNCCGLGFCVKHLAKLSAKDSKLLSFMTFWSPCWKGCSILFCILSISNVEITTEFTCDFVNNTTSTTFTSECTHNVYFCIWNAVALLIDKFFQW